MSSYETTIHPMVGSRLLYWAVAIRHPRRTFSNRSRWYCLYWKCEVHGWIDVYHNSTIVRVLGLINLTNFYIFPHVATADRKLIATLESHKCMQAINSVYTLYRQLGHDTDRQSVCTSKVPRTQFVDCRVQQLLSHQDIACVSWPFRHVDQTRTGTHKPPRRSTIEGMDITPC